MINVSKVVLFLMIYNLFCAVIFFKPVRAVHLWKHSLKRTSLTKNDVSSARSLKIFKDFYFNLVPTNKCNIKHLINANSNNYVLLKV